MKRKQLHVVPWALLFMVLITSWCHALNRNDQDAAQQAVNKVMQSLQNKNITQVNNVAVMPIWEDSDGFITELLKTGVTKTNLKVFVRSDREWDTLLSELKWGTLKEDVMNAQTIQKFGSIEGVDGLLYGTLWNVHNNMFNTHSEVKISVNLADVETGQVLWSSGPVTGEAFISWTDAVTRFWMYPLVLVALIGVLAVLILVFVIISRMFKRAMRPR